MKKSAIILDAHGNPTRTDEENNDANLPPGVQALIETRVNAGIYDIREHNRDDLQDLAREHSRKWRWFAWIAFVYGIVSTGINVFLVFYAPKEALQWIGEQVDKKLTEPVIRESADRLINEKMAVHITDKLEPLVKQTTGLEARIRVSEENIVAKQCVLEQQQEKLASRLIISELAVAAKAGSRKAYTSLNQLYASNPTNDVLKSALRELELFYDAERNKTTYEVIVAADTLADPGYANDELIQFMCCGAKNLEECAVNSVGAHKIKTAVGLLCREVKESEDLHVATRSIWALQEITGEKFRPFEFDSVARWWSHNQTNAVYNGSYTGYWNVVESMYKPPYSSERITQYTEQLKDTIDSDPDALHARCLKAGFLLMLDRREEAIPLLNYVRSKRSDYYWLSMWNAASHLKTNDTNAAIEQLNKAFAKAPLKIVELNVKMWRMFEPIANSEKVNWPSKNKAAK